MGDEFYIAVISIIFSLGVLPISIMYFINRVATRKLDTIVKVVELGGTVDPEMMRMLGGKNTNYKTDYKYGLVWLAIGIPLVIGIGLESSMGEAVFGSIPLLIGVAYLVSGKFRLRESD